MKRRKKNQLIFTVWHRPDSVRHLPLHEKCREREREKIKRGISNCMENFNITFGRSASPLHNLRFRSFCGTLKSGVGEWWSEVTSRWAPNVDFDDCICTAHNVFAMRPSYPCLCSISRQSKNYSPLFETTSVRFVCSLLADWCLLPFCSFSFPPRYELFVCLDVSRFEMKFAVHARMGARCTSFAHSTHSHTHMNLTDPYYFYIVIPFDIIWIRRRLGRTQ